LLPEVNNRAVALGGEAAGEEQSVLPYAKADIGLLLGPSGCGKSTMLRCSAPVFCHLAMAKSALQGQAKSATRRASAAGKTPYSHGFSGLRALSAPEHCRQRWFRLNRSEQKPQRQNARSRITGTVQLQGSCRLAYPHEIVGWAANSGFCAGSRAGARTYR